MDKVEKAETTMNTIIESKQSDSEQQAWAQLTTICEMVAKLTKDGAAMSYAEELDEQDLRALLEKAEIEPDECPMFGQTLTECLREQVQTLIVDGTLEPADFEFDEEQAQEEIQQDPLSVQVRGDWYSPGEDKPEPTEFEILLCTGGPAVRIRGDLNRYQQADRAYIEHQDWGKPWTQIFGLDQSQQEALLTYCQQFFFGE